MTRTRLWSALVLLAAMQACLPAAQAQSGVADSQQHIRDANAARAAGDFDGFTQSLEIAHRLNPQSLYTRYNLARGYAQTGRPGEALAMLEALVRMRVDFGMAEDPLLAPIADEPRFAALVESIAMQVAPAGDSRLQFAIERYDLVPEGIAHDDGRLFFGSMRTGEVFVADRDGRYTKFASVGDEAALAAIGMTVDRERGVLWVIAAPSFVAAGHDADAPATGGLYGFDLDSGALRERYERAIDGGYNDVTVGPDGTLYLSGTEMGIIPPGAAAIQPLATSEPVFGSNGILVAPDGEHLVTSAYPAGIAVIRLSDGGTRFLEAPADTPLYGIDGMYWHDGGLLAVQNGTPPWRLMHFTLDDALTRITATRTLEIANPDIVPTTGTIIGDEILYIGQGPVPDTRPGHVPEGLHRALGRVVVMTAPLD